MPVPNSPRENGLRFNRLNKQSFSPAAHRFVFKGDLYEDVGLVKASFGRVGSAWCERFGGIVQSPEDVPSYDGQGIRLRGEATTLLDYSNAPDGSGLWSSPYTGGAGSHTLTLNAAEAPNGEMEAFRWQASLGSNLFANWALLSCIFSSLTNPHDLSCSGWFKSADGEEYTILFYNNFATQRTITIDGTWRYFYFKDDDVATAEDHLRIMLRGETGCSESVDILGWGITPALIYGDPGTIPTNGSTATRTSEAADGAGNGLSIPMPDDMRAQMGALIQDSNGNVLTPRGPNLVTNGSFDIDLNWGKGEGLTIEGGALVEGTHTGNDNATQTLSSTLTGHRYLITWTAEGETAQTRCALGTTWTTSHIGGGTFREIITCPSDAATLFVQFQVDTQGRITEVSVEEVQPAFTLAYEFEALIGSADIPDGGSVNIGSFQNASNQDSPRIDNSSGTYLIQCGRLGAGNMNITSLPWEAGDILKVVIGVDAENNERLNGFSVNGGTAQIATFGGYGAATVSQYPVGDTAYFCADADGNDKILPMVAKSLTVYDYLIPATQEAIANA